MQPEKGFAEHFEELMTLFRKLQEQTRKDELTDTERSFFQSIDLLLANFESVRRNLPREMLNELGQPVVKVILDLIRGLKSELGIDDPQQHKLIDDIEQKINDIDQSLATNPSGDQIDQLLDARNKLMNQRDQYAQ